VKGKVEHKEGEMSVEEEEYDLQPGISSVWLITFSILYIIGQILYLLSSIISTKKLIYHLFEVSSFTYDMSIMIIFQ